MKTLLTYAQAERLYDAIGSALLVAWDGCHKIYLAMDDEQAEWFRDEYPHVVEFHMEEMLAAVERWWEKSCSLRFISAVSTNDADPNAGYVSIVDQFDWDNEEDN